MGRRTYEQVLGFGEWPYGEKPTYVFTRGAPGGDHPRVKFVWSDAGTLVEGDCANDPRGTSGWSVEPRSSPHTASST